jgi:hypothetical protein
MDQRTERGDEVGMVVDKERFEKLKVPMTE